MQWTHDIVKKVAAQEAKERGYSDTLSEEFAYQLATEIVAGDLAADVESLNEKGEIKLDLRYWSFNPIVAPDREGVWKAPHWYTTDEALDFVKDATSPFSFGVALHAYQDSFSHWQKLGKPDTAYETWKAHGEEQAALRSCILLNVPEGCIAININIDYYDPWADPIDAAMKNGTFSLVTEYIKKQLVLLDYWHSLMCYDPTSYRILEAISHE